MDRLHFTSLTVVLKVGFFVGIAYESNWKTHRIPRMQLQPGTRFSLVLPETNSFLDADLHRDPSEDLDKAENFQPEKVKES
jgi:hypothetical protein